MANDNAKNSTGLDAKPPSAEDDSTTIAALAERLEAFERRTSTGGNAKSEKRRRAMSEAGKGMKVATEFVCAVLVGGFFGWVIDSLAGTIPLFLIIFFCLGTAAGLKRAFAVVLDKEDDQLAGYSVFNPNTYTKKKSKSIAAAPSDNRSAQSEQSGK